MKLKLVLNGSDVQARREVPIGAFPYFIGRDPSCQLRPASPIVSHRHCVILERAGRAFVEDLRSTNGTCLNGERLIGEKELREGDRLTIGPLAFQIEIEGALPPDLPEHLVESEGNDIETEAATMLSDAEAEREESIDETGLLRGDTARELPSAPEVSEVARGETARPQNPPREDTASAAHAILSRYRRLRPKMT
jgi:predicted component of type VI protein secretion system